MILKKNLMKNLIDQAEELATTWEEYYLQVGRSSTKIHQFN